MISRLFLIIGLALLILSVPGFLILNYLLPLPGHVEGGLIRAPIAHEMSQCGGCGGGGGDSTIASSQPSSILVERNNPKEIDINTSDFISLKLFDEPPMNRSPVGFENIGSSPSLDNDLKEYCSNQVSNIKQTQDVDSLYNSCLFYTSIDSIFGPGYEVLASAHLISTGFDIQLLSLGEQPINQPSIEWDWNIAPKAQGIQVVNADIELRWKPVGNVAGKEDIVRQVWNRSITINVNQPFVQRGQFSVIPSITAALGAVSLALIAPIFAIWDKRQEQKKTGQVKVIGREQQGTAFDDQHEVVFKVYIDKISEQLLHENLRGSAKGADNQNHKRSGRRRAT